jgi:hypothetical protein
MPPHERDSLNLYHGTSSIFLQGIREKGLGGQNILETWGFFEFIRDLAPLCEGHCDEIDSYIFDKIVNQEVGHSNFQHGHTYLSPSKSTAARYAASNRYGSELVSEAMTRVEHLLGRNCGVEKLLSSYPNIKAVRDNDCNPLLITTPNAGRFKLRTEHGKDAARTIEKVLSTLSQNPDEVDLYHQQDNFRLDSIVPFNELIIESITITGSMSGFPQYEIGQFSQ